MRGGFATNERSDLAYQPRPIIGAEPAVQVDNDSLCEVGAIRLEVRHEARGRVRWHKIQEHGEG